MAKQRRDAIQVWAKKIGWKHRVKAVCKPCWELKYCPYGPLVEEFPLRMEPDERSCRIFGHDCPVFFVAEPFTETREIRNVSRHIPRPMQFRVLKRDNQICATCGKPVLDENIHFDHIIPWSKGGPTEEHNIRLLCDSCNRKRGSRFETEHLVESVVEHVVEPVDTGFVSMLLIFVRDVQEWRAKFRRLPDGRDVAKITGFRRKRFEDKMAEAFRDLHTVFSGQRPSELDQATFDALSERWGFSADCKTHTLLQVSRKRGLNADRLLSADMDLVRRLGWPVRATPAECHKWMKT